MKRRPDKRTAGIASGWVFTLWALALLPVTAAALAAVGGVLRRLIDGRVAPVPLLAGAAAYFLFQAVFRRPMRVYVFGHELTHAVAAWFSGFRVKSMSVSAKGGQVVLSGSNVAVALAPYCVPLYTLMAVVICSALDRFSSLRVPPAALSFLVGLTFAFHVALTVYALSQNQPDLHQAGVFLSLVLILLMNAAVLVLLLKILFPKVVSLKSYAGDVGGLSVILYDHVARFLAWAVDRAWSAAGEGIEILRRTRPGGSFGS